MSEQERREELTTDLFKSAYIPLLLASVAAALPQPQQLPFTSPVSSSFLSIPESSNTFEVHSLAAFPDHRIRARTPKGVCDDSVNQKSELAPSFAEALVDGRVFEARSVLICSNQRRLP